MAYNRNGRRIAYGHSMALVVLVPITWSRGRIYKLVPGFRRLAMSTISNQHSEVKCAADSVHLTVFTDCRHVYFRFCALTHVAFCKLFSVSFQSC